MHDYIYSSMHAASAETKQANFGTCKQQQPSFSTANQATDYYMTMHSRTTTEAAGAEIADDLYPFLRTYKDGRIERLVTHTFVPASASPGANGVASRDVVIDPSTGVSARLFLNVAAAAARKTKRLPVIVYFHGGCFCTGSAFSKLFHRYAASLSARAGALVVSVDYRLAPEHPVPAAFDDAWAALRWVTASSDDPWLACHGDHSRIFLAGESAGAVIAHDVAARVASPDGDDIGIDIEGVVLLQPFFWGPDRLPQEIVHDRQQRKMLFVPEKLDMFWPFLTGGVARNDDPRADPPAEVVASVACRRALVAVASKDLASHRGQRYAEWLRDYGEWCREVTLVESEGEDHAFHLYRPARATAVQLMNSVVKFINGSESAQAPLLDTTAAVFGTTGGGFGDTVMKNLRASVGIYKKMSNGSDNKIRVTPRSTTMVMARNALVVLPHGKPSSVPRFGLVKRPLQIL